MKSFYCMAVRGRPVNYQLHLGKCSWAFAEGIYTLKLDRGHSKKRSLQEAEDVRAQ